MFRLFLGFALLGAGSSAAVGDQRTSRANVVLILADDLGWGDPACYSATSKIPTPHLDRLASEGLRFTDAHSSSGVCVPSRFSLLTGLHAMRLVNPPHAEAELRARYGGNQPTVPLIPAERTTLPGLLAGTGYATSMIGKWHLGFNDLLRRPTAALRGGPVDRGFERYFGIPSSLDIDPYVFIDDDRLSAQADQVMPAHASPDWPDERMGEFWRGGRAAAGFRHVDVLPELTRHAETELRRLADAVAERPFFFYYALPSPHSPLVPAESFRGRTSMGIYGDYTAQTDDAVGRLLRVLDDTATAENTWVFVTSDNGPFWYPANVEATGHAAAGPWRGMKGDAWEAGHRVPLVVRKPGRVSAGAVSAASVSLTDLLVTIAAVLEVPCERALFDGADFSPALLAPDDAWTRPDDRPLVARSSGGAHVLRTGSWKFIDQLGSGGFSKPTREQPTADGPTVQLYDLARDPGETQNRALSEPARVRSFQQQLDELRRSRRPATP